MISFDLFDTLITRDVYIPSDLFYFVGKYLQAKKILNIQPQEFKIYRIEAEKRTRETSNCEEITLDEIYEELANNLKISKKLVSEIKNIELELEKESYSIIEENKKKFLNNTSIVISDTYLPEKFIRDVLNRFKLSTKYLYVSSNYRKTKYTGSLFDEVLRNIGIIKHIGDNYCSDYKKPVEKKIHSELYTKSRPTRYEEIIYKSILPFEIRTVLAGVMKSSRLESFYDDPHLQSIHEISTNVIAPFLFCYVFFVLKNAKKHGLETLYFISRDGQILYKIANVINNLFELELELKYIYGSRKAWHLAATTEIDDKFLDWAFDPTYFLSIRDICKRLEIDVLEFKKMLNISINENVNLSKKDREFIKTKFAKNDYIHKIILEKANKKRVIVIDYLKQEGFTKSKKIGIVDVGWRARQQVSLSKLLSLGNLYPQNGIFGFYVALINPTTQFREDKFITFLERHKYSDLLYYPALYESFVSADHGSCIGYMYDKGKVVPILRERLNKKIIEWGLYVQHKAIVSFTEKFTKALKKYRFDLVQEQNVSELILRHFFIRPLISDIKPYTRLMVYEDQEEIKAYPIVEKINYGHLLRLFFSRNTIFHHTIWLEGSIVMSFGSFIGNLVITLVNLRRKVFSLIRNVLRNVERKKLLYK